MMASAWSQNQPCLGQIPIWRRLLFHNWRLCLLFQLSCTEFDLLLFYARLEDWQCQILTPTEMAQIKPKVYLKKANNDKQKNQSVACGRLSNVWLTSWYDSYQVPIRARMGGLHHQCITPDENNMTTPYTLQHHPIAGFSLQGPWSKISSASIKLFSMHSGWFGDCHIPSLGLWAFTMSKGDTM